MDGIAFVADIRIPARRRSQRGSRDFYHGLLGVWLGKTENHKPETGTSKMSRLRDAKSGQAVPVSGPASRRRPGFQPGRRATPGREVNTAARPPHLAGRQRQAVRLMK